MFHDCAPHYSTRHWLLYTSSLNYPISPTALPLAHLSFSTAPFFRSCLIGVTLSGVANRLVAGSALRLDPWLRMLVDMKLDVLLVSELYRMRLVGTPALLPGEKLGLAMWVVGVAAKLPLAPKLLLVPKFGCHKHGVNN